MKKCHVKFQNYTVPFKELYIGTWNGVTFVDFCTRIVFSLVIL